MNGGSPIAARDGWFISLKKKSIDDWDHQIIETRRPERAPPGCWHSEASLKNTTAVHVRSCRKCMFGNV